MKIILYPIWLLIKVIIWLCFIGILVAAIAVFQGMSKCTVLEDVAYQSPIEVKKSEDPLSTDSASNAKNAAAKPITSINSIKEYKRPVDNTYLNFPKWATVITATDYANFLGKNRPSQFPYFSTIAQYWCNYRNIYLITKNRFQTNSQNHVEPLMAGLAYSIEYGLKGLYETTIGRLTEKLNHYKPVAEDNYAAKVDKDYAQFLSTNPWYEFPFVNKLTGLWDETNLQELNTTPQDKIRKWERKIMLSVGYGFETGIAWLYNLFMPSNTTPTIYLWVDKAPATIFSDTRIHKTSEIANQSYIIEVPRYQPFTDIILKLTKQSVQIEEIAGNNEILLTAMAPRDWKYSLQAGKLLFTANSLTQPTFKRVFIGVPVNALQSVLANLESSGAKVEHIYDY